MTEKDFKIISSEFVVSSASGKDIVEDDMKQIVFTGKSNVGKSSLINSLLSRKKLAKTGNRPGKTRLINFFIINSSFYFVDLPGYGYAAVSRSEKQKWGKMIRTYFSESKSVRLAFSIIDIRHDPGEHDLKLIEMLDGLKIPQIILLNKRDKLSNNELFVRLRAFSESFSCFRTIIDILPYSAVTHHNREAVLKYIESITSGD
jgi:GTP-binding protein